MKKKQRNMILLLAAVLLAAAAGFGMKRIAEKQGGTYACIQTNGEKIYLNLFEENSILIGNEEEGYNLIETKNGYVWVEEADCPDQICVKEGKINNSSQMIACMPHKLSVTVTSHTDS